MMSHRLLLLVPMLVGSACLAEVDDEPDLSADEQELAGVTTDTFDTPSVGGWAIVGPSGDVIQAAGGNPGAYLRDPMLDAPAPSVRTTGSSVFTGNYRTGKVETLGIDLIVHSWGTPPAGRRTVHLALWHDPGTPSNSADDVAVYADSGGLIPRPGTGWGHYEVSFAARRTTLPAGWSAYRFGGLVTGADANAIWNQTITNVTKVTWGYGPPLSANLFSLIDSGADNARILRGN